MEDWEREGKDRRWHTHTHANRSVRTRSECVKEPMSRWADWININLVFGIRVRLRDGYLLTHVVFTRRIVHRFEFRDWIARVHDVRCGQNDLERLFLSVGARAFEFLNWHFGTFRRHPLSLCDLEMNFQFSVNWLLIEWVSQWKLVAHEQAMHRWPRRMWN